MRVRPADLAAWLWLAGLGFAGSWVRLSGLSNYALSPDDALHRSVAAASSVGEVVARTGAELAHPPGLFVLLHGLLELGEADLLLRGASLLPGLLTIPVAYALGARALGRAAGGFLAMAFAFAYGPVLLSQVVRPYALLLLLLLGTLACQLGGDTRPRARALAWATLAACALWLHYSAAVALAVYAVVALGSRWRAGRPLGAWAVALALVATTGALLGWSWLRPLLDSPFRADAVADYYRLGYPGTEPTAWLRSLLALAAYASSPFSVTAALALIALAAVGGVLALRERRDLALLAFAPLAANAVLAAAELYPLYGSRHCAYLLPGLLLAPALAVQRLWEGLRSRAPAPPEVLTRSRGALLAVALGVLAVSALALSHARANDLYRERYALTEFPLTVRDYEATLAAFEAAVTPGELVLSDDQVARYAAREDVSSARERLAPGVARVTLRGRPVHVWDAPRLTFGSARDVARFAAAVLALAPASGEERIWLFTLGYGNSVLFALAEPPAEAPTDTAARLEARLRRLLLRDPGRARAPRFHSGDAEGGGVLWSVPRSALERAARLAEGDGGR
jgi:hypothetical protein